MDKHIQSTIHSQLEYFPFPRIRDGQRQMYQDVQDTLMNKGALLAYAPTGIGKTAAALSAALSVGLDDGKTIMFLTSRHSQHRIAIETLQKIKNKGADIIVTDIINKMGMCIRDDINGLTRMEFNILCARERKRKTCPYYKVNPLAVSTIHSGIYHVEQLKNICLSLGSCPHATALKSISHSNVVVADYNYMLDTGIRNIVLSKLQKDLSDIILIIDEAHNLPRRVRSLYTSTLNRPLLYGCLKESREYVKQPRLDTLIKIIFKSLPSEDDTTERYVDKDDFIYGLETIIQNNMMTPVMYDELLSILDDAVEVVLAEVEDEFYSSSLAGLLDFLLRWKQEHNHVVRISNRNGIHIIPLDPADYTSGLFSGVSGSILMSGTLYPQQMYSDLLGIRNPVFGTYASPFPRDNRLILSVDDVSTLYTRRNEKEYKKIGNRITGLLRDIPDNVIVFFPSYKLMKDISKHIKPTNRQVIMEKQKWTKEDKTSIVETLSERNDIVLLAVHLGSFSEGVDYKGNTIKGIIIVGLPLDPPSLEKNSLVKYFNKKFVGKGYDYAYHMPAFNKVLQASGRGIRNSEDRCITILMDERFNWPKYKRYFPSDYNFIRAKHPERYARLFFKFSDIQL